MPKRKHQQQLRKRFTLLLETAEALLRAIETLKANHMVMDKAINQEAKKYTSEKLLEIHDLDKLNKFIEEREKFYKEHQEKLDQIKRDVEALEEAESNFYVSALDLNKYKIDVRSNSDGKKIKKGLQDSIDQMQIEITNKRYKKIKSEPYQAMPLDKGWSAEDEKEKNWSRQRKLLKQGLGKARTFIGSLAEAENLKKLQSKPEYYALRKKYDFYKDFFAVDAKIIAHNNSVKELQQRNKEREIDELYAGEEFTSVLTPELIEFMTQQVEDEAAVIKGQKSARDIAILFGPEKMDENEKGKEKDDSTEKKYDPSLPQIIFAHNNMRRNIDIMSDEIIRVNANISELNSKIFKWQYPPVKFSNVPDENNIVVIAKLEAKKDELNKYVRVLLEQKKQYDNQYKELTPIVTDKITEYLSRDEAVLPESEQFQLKQREFDNAISKFGSASKSNTLASKFNLVLQLSQINQDLFQDFYDRLEANIELKCIAEWKEHNPDVEISGEMQEGVNGSILQLQDNQDKLFTYTQYLMQEIENKLIDGVNENINVRTIAELSELRQNLIDHIARDLMQWDKYLYARTQEKNLSVEERKSRLAQYALASNNLSNYVMQDILTKVNIHLRTLVLERWISMMNASLKIGDHHTAEVVRNALNNPALSSLHKTCMGISNADRNILAEPIPVADFESQIDSNDPRSVANRILLKLPDITYSEYISDDANFHVVLNAIKSDLKKLINLYELNSESKRRLEAFLEKLNHLKFDHDLDENKNSGVELIREILPDMEVPSENRVAVLGKASTFQTKIMRVNPDQTTELAEQAKRYEGIKAEESKHEKGKQREKMPVQESVQPSTIVALIASKAQEGKLLNNPSTRVKAILNPVIRELVIAKKYNADDAFIGAVNAAAINPDRSKSIKKLLRDYKFTVDAKQLSDIERHNKQIYYHSLIENPILADLLKSTYLKSIDPKYKKTRLLIHKINRTILSPVEDESLKSLLKQVGLTSIKDSEIKAIQAENARLHTITESIAVDNASLSKKEVNDKEQQWLHANRISHLAPSTLPVEKLSTNNEKEISPIASKNKIPSAEANQIAEKLLQTFEVLAQLLSKIEALLDKLIEEKKMAYAAEHNLGLFGSSNKNKSKVKPDKNLTKKTTTFFAERPVVQPGEGTNHEQNSPGLRKTPKKNELSD